MLKIKYLSLIGTALTADDYLKNEKWLKPIEGTFHLYDTDKDGVVTINDIVTDVKKYRHLNPDPKVIENCRIGMCDFAAALGIFLGISVTKEEFVKNYAAAAPKEVAKARNGEESSFHKYNNGIFDVFDARKDGTISKSEFITFSQTTGIHNPSFIGQIFEQLDTDGKGWLKRKEMNDLMYKLAYTLEDLSGRDKAVESVKPVKA